MFSVIDDFLNGITMYRLVLYYLVSLIVIAAILGALHILPYSPLALLYTTVVLVGISWVINQLFSEILSVQANTESVYITALILVLIISPPLKGAYIGELPFLIWAAIWAVASKFIVNIKNKHIFNPAAFAVALTAISFNASASWWIGTSSMFFFVLIGGLLIVRKVRKFDLVIAFLAAAIATTIIFAFGSGSLDQTVYRLIIFTPLVFFASIMLTEPLTMPPTRDGRIAYAVLVGVLFAPQTHIGSIYFSPELALLVGNVFSYAISPKGRHSMVLIEAKKIGEGIYDFVFKSDRKFKFLAGQYMEWTLGHKNTDARGNRRYFTIASAPTEDNVVLGVKFYAEHSSYKQQMLAMKPGDKIVASQLAGDFVLPNDQKQKLVFIAGGIGITPFRSMLKQLIDTNEQRDIVLIYSNRTADELVYLDVLEEAHTKLNVKIVCTLTGTAPKTWNGYTGYMTPELISKEVPDFAERKFYISGSNTMIRGFKESLASVGVPVTNIKTDFFPGLV